MLKLFLTCTTALAIAIPCYADNCELISSQINSKIQAAGISNFILLTTDSANAESGKIVGSCANGTKKIVYLVSNGVSASISDAMKANDIHNPNVLTPIDDIVTECKDGSVVVGPVCPMKPSDERN